MTHLLAILGNQARGRNGGVLADKVAEAFTELLREPFRRDSAHELETIEVIGVDGEKRAIKIFPRAWIARLEKAVEVGAAAVELKGMVVLSGYASAAYDAALTALAARRTSIADGRRRQAHRSALDQSSLHGRTGSRRPQHLSPARYDGRRR